MKKVLLTALLLGLSLAVGQAADVAAIDMANNDVAPVTNSNVTSRAVGDYLYYVDVGTLTGDIRLLGVEHDAANWWCTGANDMAGAYLYEIDHTGTTVLNKYAQGNTGWGWRDLVFDGKYLYASDSYVIEQIDPATGSVVGTISSPVSPARALAYIPAEDVFWTASFSSSLYKVKRDGSYTTYTNPGLSMYGAAYDLPTDIIWWWSQDGTGTLASAMDTAGTFTGDSWDGGTAPIFGIAGGACIFDDPTYGTVFAGMHQASPDNVAVYEMGVNPLPSCDIKVDGQDSGAMVYVGAPCTITIDVKAGTQYAGQNVEIWWGSQKPTYLQLYYSGPLVDVTDTVWSGPLPVGVGSYMVGIGLDGKINGSKDTLYFVDTADFQVVNPPTTYEYDDGSTENLLCWTLGGDMVWMHRFDTIPGGETIAEMHCIFGSAMYPNYAPGNGTACNVYVWNDPTNDGNPSDCVLLHTEPTVVANVDLDIYNIIPLTAPLPVVSGHFYIGCCMPHGPSQFCAPIDTTTTYVMGNGYYCGTNTMGGFDPKNLMNNQYTPAEWGNYWCIRAAY